MIPEGSPVVKIPRTCFEVQVAARGKAFHRFQFSVRLCYALIINKWQGQTLTRVGLDLRGEVFCHGQHYVALSKTTVRDNLFRLVKPERPIDGIPCVDSVAYYQFIVAGTGQALPVFTINLN